MKELQYLRPATVIVAEPGNGTRYLIVYGADFVALPDFGVAATCTPHPVEYGYLMQKLQLTERDARAVFAALNPEEREAEPVQIAEHFHPGEYFGCREDHRKDHRS